MISSAEYRERLLRMRPNVYVDGELVGRDDPRLSGGINVVSLTYDLAQEPEYEGIMTATSHLTGESINRFTHIHHSVEDLLNKQKMTRLYCQEVGGCIQRCMGIDSMNALSVMTYDADQKHGTKYNQNFINFMKYVAEERPLGRLRPDRREGEPDQAAS